jgi:hypothetical protein
LFKENAMKKHLALAGIVALLAACSHEGSSPSSKRDWGTGLNTVERKYAKSASDVHDAAVGALKSLDLEVGKDLHDEMGGEIHARRGDYSKVTVHVAALDAKSSRATVRVDPGDAKLATMVHEKMAEKLGMGTAKGALLGGNSDTFPYEGDLPDAVTAAERAAKDLDYTVIGKEVKDDWAQIDARAQDSNPVRFKIERQKDAEFPLKVTFTAGHGKTDTSKTMIVQMHDAFDREIGGHVK